MQTPTLRALLFVLTLASLAAVATVSAQQAPKPQPQAQRTLKIGVVDIGELFQKYQRKDEFETSINDQRKRLKAELDKEQDELIEMRRAFDKVPYRRGSELWLLEKEKLDLAAFRAEQKQKRMQLALKNEVEQNTLQILKEIRGTLGQYGKRYNYDLIVKTDSTDRADLAGGDRGDLVVHFQEEIFRAQISDVAYFHNALDITESVLKYLNSQANRDWWAKQAAKGKTETGSATPAPGQGSSGNK